MPPRSNQLKDGSLEYYTSFHMLTLESCPPHLWAEISPDLELQSLEEGIGVHVEKPTGMLEFGTGSQSESVHFGHS